jgi:hydrogenase nickel incorporation protein HypA/HybF
VHVDTIHLRLGPLAGVVKEALLSAFELASEQTDFARCSLVIEDVPISIHCSRCNAERPVRSMQCLQCVDCGTPGSDVVRGRDLQVSALELTE